MFHWGKKIKGRKRKEKKRYIIYTDENEGGEVHGLSVVGKVRENGTSAVTTRV